MTALVFCLGSQGSIRQELPVRPPDGPTLAFHFPMGSIVDSIVDFWQSGAKGLLIQTSLGNGFTTGAPWTNRSGFRECATVITFALSCNVLRNVVLAKSPPVCLGLHLRIWHRFGPLFHCHFPVSRLAFAYCSFHQQVVSVYVDTGVTMPPKPRGHPVGKRVALEITNNTGHL